jgi:thioredoxin-related protein
MAKDDATLMAMTCPHHLKRLRSIAAWALILAWGLTLSGAARAADSLVHGRNFQADARTATQRRVPILIVFTSPSCPYCERVKHDYLIPMHKDPAYRNRVLIREVTIGAATPLTAFDGTPTTEGAFAAAHKVFMVPTVKVLDTRGNDASEAIVGMLSPDYYFGYLETAIDEGRRKVRGK